MKAADQQDEHGVLQRSEARFRAAVGAVQGVVWTNTAAGEMRGEQLGWAKLTGQKFDAYQGYGWTDAVHPEDVQASIEAWNAAVASRAPFVFEHRLMCSDGQWRRFSIRAIPVLDSTNEILEWVGVHTDITEASAIRAQLARNAETFASLIRNNPFGIYVIDSEFRLLAFSEGAAKVFANIDPLVGRDLAEILRIIWTEPFASEAIEHFRTTLATGVPFIAASAIHHRSNIDASEAYDWRLERIALPDGSDGVACYFYDLSERVRLEEQLNHALADKDLLMREIEHRVQNSLTIVSSLLSMQRSAATSTEAKDALAAAASRVFAIGRVHQRLYKSNDLGIIEFGIYLRQLCEHIEETIGRGNISFNVTTDTVDLRVDAAVPLGIAANELITNAYKYCGTGADERVIVTLEARPDAFVLTVSNTGLGMPTDFRPNAFKGLGLKAVNALVRQIGGTIIYPLAGGRAQFEITVPA